MPRMTYSGTAGATVTYGITKPDKTVDTAPTGTGVTADIVGTSRTAYSVVVADTKRGMTIDWYEGGQYVASEEIPDDVLTPLAAVDGKVDEVMLEVDGLDGASIPTDYAKTGEAAAAAATLPKDADILAAARAAIVAEDVSTFDYSTHPVTVGNIPSDYAKTGEATTAVSTLGEPLQAEDYVVPPTPSEIDAALSATHGVGSWGRGVVETGVTIEPTTLGTDGLPLGKVMPYGEITVYLGGEAHYSFKADADGDFSFKLPEGSIWTLVASNPPKYRTTSAEVSTIV